MTKIMVVEDDASLREIYSIRITAEGYEVVSAGDGEEALALAVREKPDLILSDIMMPKISGFDMLDILRSTPEISKIKVIMMTALSADDQRQRGERLGADRYLVKSQVGIEDVINTIHEVLGDKQVAAPSAASEPAGAPAFQPGMQGAAPTEQVPAAQAGSAANVQPSGASMPEPQVPNTTGQGAQAFVSDSPLASASPASNEPQSQPEMNDGQTTGTAQ